MDDIADLSFASASISPSNKSNPQNSNHTSAFDYLSASIARSSSSLSSPNYHPSQIIPQRTPQSSRPSPAPSNSSQDAFSSIFASTTSHSTQKSRASTMTIAQRLQATQIQNQNQNQSTLAFAPTNLSPSTYGRTTKSAAVTRASSPLSSTIIHPSAAAAPLQVPRGLSRTSSEPWDFDLLEASKPSLSRVPSPNLSTSPVHSNRSSAHAKKDSWGIDPLSSLDVAPIDGLVDSQTNANPSSNLIAVDPSPGSLLGDEFGPLEDCSERLGAIALDDEPAQEDNILGLLGAPVEQLNAERIKQQAAELLQQPVHAASSLGPFTSTSSERPPPGSINRSASPPPHVLGQVVEIGFPPANARRALLQTRNAATGQWDVSAAVESLLGSQSPPPALRDGHATPPHNHDSHRGPPARSASSNYRDQANGHAIAEPSPNISAVNAKEIQDQAAELLAQASAYGSTALGKAASFWKQSKTSLTKVIEDQAATRAHGASTDGESVKPRWMRDAQAISPTSDKIAPSAPAISFSDEDMSHGAPNRASPSAPDNLVPGARQPYVSSARRKVAERTVRAVPSRPPSAVVAASQPQPELLSTSQNGRAPSPSLLPKTASSSPTKPAPSFTFPALPVVSASQQQISRSASHRVQGNELFKQGQYGHAESAYSKALEALQDMSSTARGQEVYFGCLPLFNNRAAARLKNGDGKGASEDVERVIEVVFCEDSGLSRPAEYLCKRLEASAQRMPHELREVLDVAEQLGKALGRRAKIREEAEKWADARSDWEHCRNLGGGVLKGAGGVRIVAEGVARCQKAVGGPPAVRAAPRAGPPPTKAVPRSATQAVQKLRQANEQAETEANEKLDAKDMVDAKIACWKAGKESNLRALLASLDQVLWKGLEWKKVGMGELLSEGQVKSKYVRAISKVHPDKIPKEASIVEQMIAKSVFATLNEAWISMQG